MLPSRLNGITAATIRGLVEQGVEESKTLDFKRDRIGKKEEDRREFLADVSALANSEGGDLILGVDDHDGRAVSAEGIEVESVDEEIRRLEEILRNGLEPRLPPVEIHWIANTDQKIFIVIRVPRSFLAPHRVTFRDHSKFYRRNARQKYPMDVSELRTAFLATEGVFEAIRRFRRERVAVIQANEGPVALAEGAKVIVHVVPLAAFVTKIDMKVPYYGSFTPVFPLMRGGLNTHYTMEGFATYAGVANNPAGQHGYGLLFRAGMTEAVYSVGFAKGDQKCVDTSFEGNTIGVVERSLQIFGEAGLSGAVYVFMSFVSIRDHALIMEGGHVSAADQRVRVDTAMLPEVEIDASETSVVASLRPVFDRAWNTFGKSHSFNYSKEGTYLGFR